MNTAGRLRSTAAASTCLHKRARSCAIVSLSCANSQKRDANLRESVPFDPTKTVEPARKPPVYRHGEGRSPTSPVKSVDRSRGLTNA